MSNLTELLPAGGGGKNVNFVASGTLPSGQTVALKTNGQVEAIAAVAQSAGSPVVFEAAESNWVASTFDSVNNKVVIAYSDNPNSGYGTAIVGTVSGSSISFGTPVVFQTSLARHISATYDSNSQKIIIAYSDNSTSDRGTAIVGTVSGTSISFGTAVVYNSGFTYFNSATFDSTNNKVVIAYRDDGNSQYGTAIVGTVSGTSISFGSEAVFETAEATEISSTYDSTSGKIVIAYRDKGNSSHGTAIVGTVSGTSISFGAAAVFESASTTYISSAFDSNANKVVIAYRDGGNADSGTAVVGTVSGTGISFGTPVVFNGDSSYFSPVYDPTAKKIVISYRDDAGSGYGTMISATVSGTSISFEAKLVYENSSTTYNSATLDTSNNKVVTAYKDNGASSYGTAAVLTVGSSNNTSFIGIADADIANAASGSVTIKGGISTIKGGTYTITVVNSGSGNKYAINGVEQSVLNLYEGATYKFDQSSGTNSGHPFRFSTTADGTHGGGSEYTTGVTTSGVPGNAGAYTQIIVASGAPTLYYYCSVHSGMGGTANTLAIVPNSTYYVQDDGTLATTSSSVLAGRALSSTSINLDYTTWLVAHWLVVRLLR